MPSQSYQPRILRPITTTALVPCDDCSQAVIPAYAIWSFDADGKEKIVGYLCEACKVKRETA